MFTGLDVEAEADGGRAELTVQLLCPNREREREGENEGEDKCEVSGMGGL